MTIPPPPPPPIPNNPDAEIFFRGITRKNGAAQVSEVLIQLAEEAQASALECIDAVAAAIVVDSAIMDEAFAKLKRKSVGAYVILLGIGVASNLMVDERWKMQARGRQ